MLMRLFDDTTDVLDSTSKNRVGANGKTDVVAETAAVPDEESDEAKVEEAEVTDEVMAEV